LLKEKEAQGRGRKSHTTAHPESDRLICQKKRNLVMGIRKKGKGRGKKRLAASMQNMFDKLLEGDAIDL